MQATPDQSGRKRQQRHIPGAFNRPLGLPLTTGTVATALARVYLAAIGQEFRKSIDVFVVNVLYAASAESALSLLTGARKTRFPSVAVSAASSLSVSLCTSL